MFRRTVFMASVAFLAIVLWLACEGTALAQEPYTGTLEISWEVYTSTKVISPTQVINQCVFESRQDGEVVHYLTTSVPDCRPLLDDPGSGRCGSVVTFTLDVPWGNSTIHNRCVWIDGDKNIAYLLLDPPTEQDEDHFWLWDEVYREQRTYLPLIMRNTGPIRP